VLVVVRTKRADLKDISSRLRDQLKICQEEINLGGRWGLRGPSFSTAPIPDRASEGVDALLDSVLSEMDRSPVPGTVEEFRGVEDVTDNAADAVVDEVVGSLPDRQDLPSPSETADQIDSLIDLF
jgi:hypothetical protein